ncbi:MAG: SIS domain-containing protein [Puniceicoccaceae bacterium]
MQNRIIEELVQSYPSLEACVEDITTAFDLLAGCYEQDGIVYLCGNGGSAADAAHIVGELMKAFDRKRPLPDEEKETLGDPHLADYLEGSLRAIDLSAHTSLTTAIANDTDPNLIFAQQVYGYGRAGDVLWAISTSGNAKNVIYALKAARAKGLKCIGMTAHHGGTMKNLCNVCIRVPETATYKAQELHLPVYHALCRMLEARFWDS